MHQESLSMKAQVCRYVMLCQCETVGLQAARSSDVVPTSQEEWKGALS